MFASRKRPVVFPQAEHARLAGTIAAWWGNGDIVSPPLPRDAFALGVTTHDRGYGPVDVLGIGQVDEATWIATQRRGITRRARDPVADTVALLHLRRLVSGQDRDPPRDLVALIDTGISENLERTTEDLTAFRQADTVTAICDMISFLPP